MAVGATLLRQAAARAALVVASLSVVLLVAECGLRAVAEDAPTAREPIPPALADLPVLRGFEQLVQPKQRGTYAGALYETNRSGLRGPWRPFQKQRGQYRIVLIGDSLAMGSGVVYEDTYGARLEKMFDGADVEVQVVNVAVAGLSIGAIAHRLEKLGLRYQPDLVVYGYTMNDIDGPAYRRTNEDRYVNPYHHRDSPSRLVRWAGPRLVNLWELIASPKGSYSYELDDNYFHNPAAIEVVHQQLARIQRLSKQRGACSVLLVQPHFVMFHWLHPFERHYEAVGRAAEERGFTVVQALPHFVAAWPNSARDYWIHYNDSHPNPMGHRIFAEALYEGLQDLPAGCGVPLPRAS